MTEQESLIALNMIERVGPITIKRLLEAFGNAATVLEAGWEKLRRVEGIGPEMAKRVSRWRESVDIPAEMEKIEKEGVKIVTLSDPSYPECLKHIYDPPPVLYVKGEIKPEDNHAIAVVGARRCSHYGRMSAERLASQIARIGLTVVSGLARGIDTAAHQGALSAGGRTIAVLGSGLDRLYPAENKKLADKIAASGAVITEFALGTTPQKTNFPLRNRVISGLSLGVVVIEAARRSGSLITAAIALEQGRTVFAMPGRIDSYASKGTHALIKDGAKLVESLEDICEEFPYLFPEEGRAPGKDKERALPRPKLTPEEERVMSVLSAQERPIDEISAACKMPPAAVSGTLLSLELKRLINQLPGKLFRKRS